MNLIEDIMHNMTNNKKQKKIENMNSWNDYEIWLQQYQSRQQSMKAG